MSDEPKAKWWSLTSRGACLIAIVLCVGIGLVAYIVVAYPVRY